MKVSCQGLLLETNLIHITNINMEIRYATISKTGRRSNNEDCFNVLEMPEHNCFMGIVCDGMGGHSFGETASETVCNTISDFWNNTLLILT